MKMKRDGQMGLFHAVNVEGIERPVHVYGTLKRKCKGLRIFPQAFCMAKQWNASLFMRNARKKKRRSRPLNHVASWQGCSFFRLFLKPGTGESRTELLKNSSLFSFGFFYHKKKKGVEENGKRKFFVKNLKACQKSQGVSLMEFAEELGVPKSTLRAILKDGNTTFDTAIRIAVNMGMGLDRLVYDKRFSDKQFILKHMEQAGTWFTSLPEETRGKIAELIVEIWKLMDR